MCVIMKPVFLSAATGRIVLSAIAIAAVASLPSPSQVKAQSADLVLCDRVAADPADPDKPADVKGVSDVAPSDVRHRDQILQGRVRLIAAGALPVGPRLR